MIKPDGIDAAAQREVEFHPKAGNTVITAWKRRATTLKKTIAETNALRAELDALKEELRARPF